MHYLTHLPNYYVWLGLGGLCDALGDGFRSVAALRGHGHPIHRLFGGYGDVVIDLGLVQMERSADDDKLNSGECGCGNGLQRYPIPNPRSEEPGSC